MFLMSLKRPQLVVCIAGTWDKFQTCLCAWRQIETLSWWIESLPLSYSLSSICSCGPQGIMDHRADCWPLHRENSETAGHPSQGQTDVQVTQRGSEWNWWQENRGSEVMSKKGMRRELLHSCKYSPSTSEVGQMLSTILRPQESVSVSHTDSATSLSAVGLMPLISWLSLPKCGRDV